MHQSKFLYGLYTAKGNLNGDPLLQVMFITVLLNTFIQIQIPIQDHFLTYASVGAIIQNVYLRFIT
jgi:hypothetical protein